MIHQKFPRKSTEFKIVEQDKYYEVINRKCFQIVKRKDEAPKLEIRSKNVHGEFIVEEEMFYDEKLDIFESTTTYESEYITTENSSEASEVVENSTNEEMETTNENSDTEGLNDSNENNENSDTGNSG